MESVKSIRAVWEHPSLIVSRIQTGYSQVMGTITQRELRELFDSFRFRVAALLIIALMILSAALYSSRYQTEMTTYQELMASYQLDLDGASVQELADLSHPLAKPPWKLAFLVDGKQQDVPNVYRLSLSTWQEPWLERARASEDRLPAAEPLDWAFLIRVVFSLVAFILSYDSICGVRQRATLKIILSYAIKRWQVLTAKVFALWVLIAAPFLCGAVGSLAILRFVGNLQLDQDELIKVGEIALLGLFAIGFFVILGVLTSLLSREPSRSLALLAMIWITMVVVIPAASGLLAHRIQPIPTPQAMDQVIEEIKRDVERENGGPGSRRSLEVAASDGFVKERETARIQNERFRRQEDYRRKMLNAQFSQIELARNLAAISPLQLIQDIGERLVGSGTLRDQLFVHRAWAHSERLGEHVKEMELLDPDSSQLFFFPDYMSTTKPPTPPPIFNFEEMTIGSGLSAAWGRIILFGLAIFVFAAATLVLFSNYQVG